MEDIGGCRAIVRTVGMVRRVCRLYEKSKSKHKLLRTIDYLTKPRTTGYRGVHLIYEYYSDQKPASNGLKIEIQLRSRKQHAWATAVETVDAFTQQGLKDDRGDERWQRFFALMGTYIALKERCNPVANTPSDSAAFLRDEIEYYAKELEVIQRLHSYRATLEVESFPGAHSYLVQLDVHQGETKIIGFKENALETAQELYVAMEKEASGDLGKDVVLVSVNSLESLKRAYPNYFADTGVFIGIVNQAISKSFNDADYES
jgi:hypothetical protein